ncbi:VWA domain-containing protein [uncultured Fusobacterium sp.]|uniref:vWA domain-containing protein n=1 Tax=uncultured Fusobacterium sp. TaxID=159267 RepID=UPI0025DB62FC|nr:VWA domain-containing protein [uncultured Fusobacterium sp.]
MEFKAQKKKVLPLILLLDISSSMRDRIDELNRATREMIEELANQESLKAEIHICIITFGGNSAKLHQQLVPVSQVELEEFTASGSTPLGGALKIAKGIVEDRNQIPSDSYRPMVILMSDGAPNDYYWEETLRAFIEEGRSKKCERLALGIGNGYDEKMLKQFSSYGKIYEAEDAKDLVEFFQFVTMTVKEKSISSNPSKTPEKYLLKSLLKESENAKGEKLVKDELSDTELEELMKFL